MGNDGATAFNLPLFPSWYEMLGNINVTFKNINEILMLLKSAWH